MTARKAAPAKEHFHPPCWVLRQPGLRPTLQSDRSLVLESEHGPIGKVTVRVQFDARRQPQWFYRYTLRRVDKGTTFYEYYAGTHGDPTYDEMIEASVDPK